MGSNFANLVHEGFLGFLLTPIKPFPSQLFKFLSCTEATSNRRHLIREFFGDRPSPQDAEEVQAWDTVHEKLSFRDRFGLTLTFLPANQNTYLEIVHHLAQQAGLTISADDLEFRAKQWATQHNGRSGRTARQFVDYLIGEQNLIQL